MSQLHRSHLPPPQAFLHIVPAPGDTHSFSSKQQFHLHPVVGNTTGDGSSLIRGLLVEVHDWDLECYPEQLVVKRDARGKIVSALFDISMAGDPSDGL